MSFSKPFASPMDAVGANGVDRCIDSITKALHPRKVIHAVDENADINPIERHNLISSLTDEIVNMIIAKLRLDNTTVLTLMGTTLATNITSLILSIINVCANETTVLSKWIIPLTCLASVAQVIAMLIATTSNLNFRFDTVKGFIYNLISEYTHDGDISLDALVSQSMAVPNAFDPQYILSLVTNLVTWVICAGAGLFGWDVRALNGILTLREKCSNLSRDTQEVVSSIMKSIFDYDITLSSAVSDKITKLVLKTGEMVRTPAVTYLADATKLSQLEECLKEVEVLQTASLTPEQQKAYGPARSQLNHNYTALSQIHATMSTLSAQQDRPTTVCVVLKGLAGIGKSNVATYIMRQVADAMGYSRNIYNLEMGPHGSFCEIYRKQALGVYNEFGKMKDNSQALYNINSVLSNDPVNFEAAELAFKHQACALRLVFITTNKQELRFLSDVTEGTNVAFITRVMEVEITDPKFEGRGQPNLHRRPDFSHLSLTWQKLKNPTPTRFDDTKERTLLPMSTEQLINFLKFRVAEEERHYLSNQLRDGGDLPPTVQEGMNERIAQLQKFSRDVVPNAGSNTSFFVARWQGPAGTGKTTAARCFSATMQSAFSIPTIHVTDPTFPIYAGPDKPHLFLVDDIPITSDNARAYHTWINTLPRNSCVLLITNEIVPPEPISRLSFRHFASSFRVGDLNIFSPEGLLDAVKGIPRLVSPSQIRAFHLSDHLGPVLKTAPGLSRRLGFNGLQVIDGNFVDPPRDSGICLTTGTQAFSGVEPVHCPDLAVETGLAFVEWMRSSEGFVTVNHTLPDIPWDIWIEIRDFDLYKERVRSVGGYRKMFADESDPAGRVHIRQSSIDTFLRTTDVATWVMPNIGDADDFFRSAETFLYRLLNAFPTAIVKLTWQNVALLYAEGVIHRDDSRPLDQTEDITLVDGVLSFQGHALFPSMIAELIVNGTRSGRPLAIPKMSLADLSMIISHVKTHKTEPDYYLYSSALDELVDKMKKARSWKDSPMMRWLTTDSPLRTTLFVLVGGLSSLGMFYGLYRLFSKEEKTTIVVPYRSVYPNTKEDEQERYTDRVSKRQEAYAKAKGPTKGQSARATAKFGEFGTTYVQPLLRYSNDVPIPLRATNFKDMTKDQLVGLLDKFKEIQPNMVSQAKTMPTNPRLESMISKLRTNVARIVSDNGVCHGLFLCKRFVLTVKHTVYDTDEIKVVWRPSELFEEKSYTAKVVYTDHNRDIALLAITDLTCPEAPSILKYITYEDEDSSFRDDGIFVRPFDITEVVYGQVFFNDKYVVPLGKLGDPRWSPSKYYDFSSYHMSNGTHQVRNGDCGLPLLRNVGGEYFLIGINCAKGCIGEANFSMINRQILTSAMSINPNSIQSHTHKCLKCGNWYKHTHNMSRPDHKQRPNQCPHKTCEWYGVDETRSEPCEAPFPECEVVESQLLPGHVNIPPYNEIVGEIRPETEFDNHEALPVIGFSRNMRLISNPKHSRVFCKPPGATLESNSLPSVLKEADLSPSARETLPKTVSGKPNILLRQALKTTDRFPMEVDESEFLMIADWTAEWCALHYGENHKPLRTHEVINGMVDAPVRGMRMKTSAGPYMKIQYGITDKTQLFKVTSPPESPVVIRGFADTPAALELERLYNASWKSVQAGRPISVIIKDNMKVELLPKEKVLAGETRLFCEVDLPFNMILRKATGSFLGAMAENHMFSGIAIGMNPYLFPNYTDSHTPRHYNVVCSDLKSMDKTLHPWFLQLYFHCILRCSDRTQITPILASALFESMATSIHVQNGILYYTGGTNPSGVYGTAPINSIAVVAVLIRLYWKAVLNTSLRQIFTLHEFDTLMKKEILGDDTRIRCHPDLKITFEQLRETFRECGLNCVPSKTPGGELGDFCSRAYFRDNQENVTYGALKKDTIVDLVLWVELGDKEIMVTNYQFAMFEACMWDEEFYNSIVDTIKQAETFYHLPKGKLQYFPYRLQRKHLAKYIRGEVSSPMLTDMKPCYLNSDLDSSPIMSKPNFVGKLLEHHAKSRKPFTPTYVEARDPTTGNWQYTLTYEGGTFVGTGVRKSDAKNDAYGKAYGAATASAGQPNAATYGSWHKHTIRYRTEPDSSCNGRVLAIYADDILLCTVPLPEGHTETDEEALLPVGINCPLVFETTGQASPAAHLRLA